MSPEINAEIIAEDDVEAETSKKGPIIWAAIIIILTLIAFFIGFKLSSKVSYETIEYNNLEFSKIENMWYAKLQFSDKLVTLPLRFNPFEVENVSIKGRFNESFNRKDIHIAFDPRNTTGSNFSIVALAAAELSLSLVRTMNINAIASCTHGVPDICENRPIVSCGEENRSIILLIDAGSPEILLYENCIILKGYGMNLLRSVDRFLYQWYGIMKD